jgi:predicted amino acid dehydrogenase
MKTGTSGTVKTTMSALTQSTDRMRKPTSNGTVAVVTSVGSTTRK